jgi:hypothetical protein
VIALVSIVTEGKSVSVMIVAYLPEVLDHRIALGVATVVGVLLPVVDIDVCYATDEQLELTLIEDVDEIGGNELVEALNKGVKLFIDPLLNAPLRDEPVSSVSKSRLINVTGIAKLTRRIPSCSRSSPRCPYHLP